MARSSKSASAQDRVVPVEDYEHSVARRTNNPPAGLAHLDRDETPTKTLTYDPHLDPQLVWAGKAERDTVEVPAPSIHVHEELSAQKIIGSVRRQRLQQALFDIDVLDPDKAVEFYQHDLDWSNRMILGDSLTVMTSLVERERMAGTVQCVFMDPPYGIKYNSNFQTSTTSRAVKDGDDASLTREPEMIQAYRDTWELGVHSYLTYLRDRISIAHELLSQTGSLFLQIGDDHVHRVRSLIDEVFGEDNFVVTIVIKKKSSTTPTDPVNDYVLWVAKDRTAMTVNPLYERRNDPGGGGSKYTNLFSPSGEVVSLRGRSEDEVAELVATGHKWARVDYPLISQDQRDTSSGVFNLNGKEIPCPKNQHWTYNTDVQMPRLADAGRIYLNSRGGISGISLWDDFPFVQLSNIWDDMHGEARPVYVVQTNRKVVERCVLMTTSPGDLVLDPTCGSGTSAFVAESLGRRWITIDTSRVALALARERLLSATYPYFLLSDAARGVDAGLQYEVAEKTTLATIARDELPEAVALVNRPKADAKRVRVTGPFTVEALARYSTNPSDAAPGEVAHVVQDSNQHVEQLLEALKTQGIPRPGAKPAPISSLTPLSTAGALQAEGIAELGGKPSRFAVALGPKFGAVTMAQVSDALREAIGFDLVVFAGFAVSADAQEKLATGKVGGTPVSLLLANPDLLVGDLLKNTKASQTFRLYSAPDVRVSKDKDGYRVHVEGVDSFDAATGDVVSYGKAGHPGVVPGRRLRRCGVPCLAGVLPRHGRLEEAPGGAARNGRCGAHRGPARLGVVALRCAATTGASPFVSSPRMGTPPRC